MLFNSYAFALFFAVLFPAYWLLARWPRAQNVLLLAAAYYFYSRWNARVPLAADPLDGDGLCLRPLGRAGRGPAKPREVVVALSMALEPGHARLLQVLQLLRREPARALAGAGLSIRCGTWRSCCRSASRSTRSSR